MNVRCLKLAELCTYLFSWKKKSDNAIMGAAAPLLVGIKRINLVGSPHVSGAKNPSCHGVAVRPMQIAPVS